LIRKLGFVQISTQHQERRGEAIDALELGYLTQTWLAVRATMPPP